ncbi:EamA family transporter [Permianibacter sp. IMCC34836]|uniref:EamA family transporter n=1 Tax=Permianibacter fluminis TaxID=2738515 RepID=UPI001557A21A|nr:EamA family transporter [Permianibacter fluminis]NQD37809.1 EamA family transporter [Permianibacter fluminis]
MKLLQRVPPIVLVLVSIFSVQAGAAFAKHLFVYFGPLGTVFLRVFLAALVLLLWARPRWREMSAAGWRTTLMFATVLGGMNATYYLSLERLPLGLAVTIEFIGPLSVALWQSHRLLDVIWVILAAAGIALLNPFSGALDPIGIGLALAAGFCWGAYIVLGQRMSGSSLPGQQGLALAMAAAALVLVPFGAVAAAPVVSNGWWLLAAVAVALLSSVVPYSLEIEALRRMPTRVFGILMSLEPAVAAMMGLLILGEALGLNQIVAIALVMLASYGAMRYAKPVDHPG